MNALFFIMLTFFLIVLQTIIFPSFSWFSQCFDLLIIDVLFLSLWASHLSMVLAIIIIGCIMDSISGSPFCFHIFSYLWIYLIVYLGKQLVFKQSIIFILILSIVSVLIQHGLLLFSVFVRQGADTIWEFDFGLLAKQMFWAFIFIPPAIWFVNVCRQNWIITIKSIKKQAAQKYRG